LEIQFNMPDTDIGSAVASNLTNSMTDYSVDPQQTDGAEDQKETTYINVNWGQYFGYYKQIPELTAAIDAKATWTVGKGYTADPQVELILDSFSGWGKDTFNTIIENMIRTYHISGDAYAEIILDDEENIINLKPLDPSTIKIVAGHNGRIIRYEQISKVKGKPSKKFQTHRIFHLARNRVADEIHGVSIIPAIENIILMRNEAMTDWKRVLHRNIDPLWIFHLDTDDTSKIASFKTKMDNARGSGENMYIPKGAVVPELVNTSTNASLNPMAWIQQLNQYFFQATGVPDIIVGGGVSGSLTEASAKIAYLAFQQTIEEEQLFIEEQVSLQLGLEIQLEFPASLENETLSDKPQGKDELTQTSMAMEKAMAEAQTAQVQQPQIQEKEKAIEPNDKKVELEGRK
jgi:hypothetical protein